MAPRRVIEGTWEEVAQKADSLAGKHVRLIVVENGHDEERGNRLPFHLTATPAERARAWEEWCSRPRPRVPPLTDEAISREAIYSPDRF